MTVKNIIDSTVDDSATKQLLVNGGFEWRDKAGKFHRVGGPATLDGWGTKMWYRHGQVHREDGPAVEFASGGKQWHVNDELHREDGPAIVDHHGNKQWFIRGQQHRDDGPAVVDSNGNLEWYRHGKRHRTDGPAKIYHYFERWFVNGIELTEDEFDRYVDQINGEVLLPPGKKLKLHRR